MKNSQIKFKTSLERSAMEVDEEWYLETLLPILKERKKVAEYILRECRLDRDNIGYYKYLNKRIKEVLNI